MTPMHGRSTALLVTLALAGGCAEDASQSAEATAAEDVNWYLDNRGVAADRLERATRPPWWSMQRRSKTDRPPFESAPPALKTEQDLCCLGPGTWPVQTLLEQGQFAKALPEASRLLHEEPSNDLGRLLFARAAQQVGQRDDALREYQHVIARAPGVQQAYVAAGELLSEMSRHDEALAALDRALAIASTPEAHLARGTALCQASKIDQAEWDLWKAQQGDPEDGHAYYALAWIAAWRGQPAQVIYLLRFAARDEKVFRERINQRRISADPGFTPIREHPGFVQYLTSLPAAPLEGGSPPR